MVTKKMNTAAKPIAAISSMRSFSSKRLGCGGLKTQAFVKEILDKYTEKLHYPFDNAALIFLKQAADWREQEKTQEQMVSVTCNLLSYCIRNNIYEKRYSPSSNIDGMLYRQLVPYLEQRITVLKQTAPAQGAELERFYKEYRELSDTEHTHSEVDKEEIIRQRERLAERTERLSANAAGNTYANTQSVTHTTQQNNYVKNIHTMPITMSQSFFSNLYHWMRENQVKNYKQLWQWQNTRQLRQYNLDYRLNQIANEADFQKQQQQLIFAVQEYGGRLFLDRLQAADDKRRETILKVLQSMTQIRQQSINQEQQDISAVEGGSDVIYEDIQEKITQTLSKSDETTRKLFEERTEEYKSRFLEIIREGKADSEESLRIFSNEEIELLLRTADDISVQRETLLRQELITGQEKPYETGRALVDNGGKTKSFSEKETVLKQSVTEHADVVQREHSEKESSLIYEIALKKLDLIAMREVAQHFIDERSTAVQRERLEQITELLSSVSFASMDYDTQQETDIQKGQEVFRQYEQIQTEIRNILNTGDDVTKMLLEEKTEEYKSLFYDLIRERRYEETVSVAHNEENPEIFSDTEIELLLRTTENNSTQQETILRQEQSVQETVLKERQPELGQMTAAQSGRMERESALVYKTALKKLDLIAMREVAQHFIDERSTAVQRERLEQITELLDSISFAPLDYDTQQETDIQNGQEIFRQYEQIQTEIRNILNVSDDVTKMLLEEKTEEYKSLFYDLIREHRYEETDSAAHNEENPEIFSDTEIELLLRTAENNNIQQETILRQEQSVQETVLRERQPEPEQRAATQSGRMERESSLVYKTALKKLDLIAMREVAQHFIDEQSPIVQRERLEQITELLDSVSFEPRDYDTQQETDRQKGQEVFRQYEQLQTKIRNILNTSDDVTKMLLEEKTEEYKSLFYDLIREHRYEETVSGNGNEENPEIFSDTEIELLLRTAENNSTQQETILRQEQSVQETVLRERQSEPEQRAAVQSVRLDRESSLVYKTALKKLGLAAMRESARHFIDEQSPIVQRERLEQITELLESVSLVPYSHETQTESQRQAEQEIFRQYDTTQTEIQNILNRSDDITKVLLAENTEEYETLFYDLLREHRYVETGGAAEASALARTLVYIASGIPQANAAVRTADTTQEVSRVGAAAQADAALINPSSTQQQPQDLSMELLTQYNSDFTRPPTGEVRNRLVLREGEGAVIPISVAGTGAGLQPQEIVYALAKNTAQQNEGSTQSNESSREIREQEIIIRRLESDLLDYQNELRNRTNQLDEVEKKLSGQQKELEQFREKSYTVEGRLKTAQDSGKMMAKIKDELLLERMRSGMD